MPRAPILRLALTDFRSYARAELAVAPGLVCFYGRNGAGKTNLLEALSWLAPGRGLRSASVAEVGRRAPDETPHRAWAVLVELADRDGPVRLGVGAEAGSARRKVRIDGETATPAHLAQRVRMIWLTPAHDRLFLEGSSERRRFLDRLVFADHPDHAADVAAYEKALRERLRLLTADAPADPVWLDALEATAARAGAALTLARRQTVAALAEEIAARADRPFPRALIRLTAPENEPFDLDQPQDQMEPVLARGFARSRARDAAAGRALFGPHRCDLQVVQAEGGRAAAEASTGEQKALLLNLVLAQAARLARDPVAPAPILLLDEVAAHLDPVRRAALYEELGDLNLQAFLTGVEKALFEGLERGARVRVDAAQLYPD